MRSDRKGQTRRAGKDIEELRKEETETTAEKSGKTLAELHEIGRKGLTDRK